MILKLAIIFMRFLLPISGFDHLLKCLLKFSTNLLKTFHTKQSFNGLFNEDKKYLNIDLNF